MSQMNKLTGPVAERLVAQILDKRESLSFETKRVSGKMVAKALETVCAFANTEGGILLLGVEDFDKARGRARLFGIDENPEAVDELQRKLLTQFHPPIEGLTLNAIETKLANGQTGQLVFISVPSSPKVHSIVDDGTWTRLPSSNREMRAAEITELAYRRGVTTAESDAVDLPLPLIETADWTTCCALAWASRLASEFGRPRQQYCCSPSSPATCWRNTARAPV